MFNMQVDILVGKGGVGKSSLAAALACASVANEKKTGLIDWDGGHSCARILGLSESWRLRLVPNRFHFIEDGSFSLAVIEGPIYRSILESKAIGVPFESYMKQFPESLGIVPFFDMLGDFYGVPIDIAMVQKFVILADLLSMASERGYDYVVIDVEPTAGLERLFKNASAMTRSIGNLKKLRALLKLAMRSGAPDIKAYLDQSPYVEQIGLYQRRISAAVQMLQTARYLAVCTPERGPIEQVEEVRSIVDRFGGKIQAQIVNNIQGRPYEAENIALLRPTPRVLRVRRVEALHTSAQPVPHLIRIGEELNAQLR